MTKINKIKKCGPFPHSMPSRALDFCCLAQSVLRIMFHLTTFEVDFIFLHTVIIIIYEQESPCISVEMSVKHQSHNRHDEDICITYILSSMMSGFIIISNINTVIIHTGKKNYVVTDKYILKACHIDMGSSFFICIHKIVQNTTTCDIYFDILQADTDTFQCVSSPSDPCAASMKCSSVMHSSVIQVEASYYCCTFTFLWPMVRYYTCHAS